MQSDCLLVYAEMLAWILYVTYSSYIYKYVDYYIVSLHYIYSLFCRIDLCIIKWSSVGMNNIAYIRTFMKTKTLTYTGWYTRIHILHWEYIHVCILTTGYEFDRIYCCLLCDCMCVDFMSILWKSLLWSF